MHELTRTIEPLSTFRVFPVMDCFHVNNASKDGDFRLDREGREGFFDFSVHGPD